MKTLSRKSVFTWWRYLRSGIYVALGIVVIVQMAVGVGLRFEALPGVVLGGALIAFGLVRAGFPWKRRAP